MGAIWRTNWRTPSDNIIDRKHMLSKTICVCGDGSRGGGGDGGWRRWRQRAACGVRRAATASGGVFPPPCGGVRLTEETGCDDGVVGEGAAAADVLIMGGSDFP